MNATVSLPWTAFLAAVLAVWRVTHLLWGEDGPFDLFVRLRKFAGAGFFGRLDAPEIIFDLLDKACMRLHFRIIGGEMPVRALLAPDFGIELHGARNRRLRRKAEAMLPPALQLEINFRE